MELILIGVIIALCVVVYRKYTEKITVYKKNRVVYQHEKPKNNELLQNLKKSLQSFIDKK
jgi:large-conductance mechanosensitive channel